MITFKSQASADVMMFGDVARQMMGLFGKEASGQGTVTVEDLPSAITRLKAAVAVAVNKMEETGRSTGGQARQEVPQGTDQDSIVSIAQRAQPLLELFEQSLQAKVPVVWGVWTEQPARAEHTNAMSQISCFHRTLLLLLICSGAALAATPAPSPKSALSPLAVSTTQPKPDLSGRRRVGKASFYAKKFAGRKMADGKKMNQHRNNAASKTLPLGTTAKVTNLETGQSAKVTIQDRGPYVQGRIVDLSTSTAKKIGITPENGVAKVKVDPIAVPQPDGSVKAGVAAPATTTEKRNSGDGEE